MEPLGVRLHFEKKISFLAPFFFIFSLYSNIFVILITENLD